MFSMKMSSHNESTSHLSDSIQSALKLTGPRDKNSSKRKPRTIQVLVLIERDAINYGFINWIISSGEENKLIKLGPVNDGHEAGKFRTIKSIFGCKCAFFSFLCQKQRAFRVSDVKMDPNPRVKMPFKVSN